MKIKRSLILGIVLSLLIVPLISGLPGCASRNTPQRLTEQQREIMEKQRSPANGDEGLAKEVPPLTAEGYRQLGDQYSHQGNPDVAFIYYLRSLQLDPNQPLVHFKMGRLFLQKGLYESAWKEFQEVLKVSPQHALANDGMGRTCFFMRQYPEAEEYFRKALSVDPALWEAHNFLGIIYDYQKDFARAADEYRTALSIRPNLGMLLNNLGTSLLWKGDYEEAMKAFTGALKLEDSGPKVHNNLALALAKLGRYQEAFEAFRKGGDLALAYHNLGRIHMMEGRYQEAIENFQKAIEARPVYYAEAHNSLENARAAAAAVTRPVAAAVPKPAVNFAQDTQRDDLIAAADPIENAPARYSVPALEEKPEDTEPGTLYPVPGIPEDSASEPASAEDTKDNGPAMVEAGNSQQLQVNTLAAEHSFSFQVSSELERIFSKRPVSPRIESPTVSPPPPALNSLPDERAEPPIADESRVAPDQSSANSQIKIHTVRKGESLHGIARLYHIDIEPIPDINRLSEDVSLAPGVNVLIPLPKDQPVMPPQGKNQKPDKNGTKSEEIIYRIKEGDTLWGIASKYNVSVSEIKRWNNLNGINQIRPSDRLKLKIKPSTMN